VLGALLAGALLIAPPGAGAAAPPPAGDVAEDFSADPLQDTLWQATGTWTHDPVAGAVVSSATPAGSLTWTSNQSYTGAVAARIMLYAGSAGAAARARVVFARDPVSGATRWVQFTAGNPGTVTLGQTGRIRGTGSRTIRSTRIRIPKGVWQDVGVRIGAKSRVTVTLNGRALFTATVAPTALGQFGIASTSSKIAVDSFTFSADPDAEPCNECHAGSYRPADAADVYAYWDGSWWRRTQGGSTTAQRGGHGDPAGLFAMSCTGGAGCHSMRLPRVDHHRNGVYEPRENITVNPWHLRSEFINQSPSRAWDVQMTFDDFCATACHAGFGIRDMRHQGLGANRPYLQLGYGLTEASGSLVPPGIPLDADLTSAAGGGAPHFATCVTCHDPHGSPAPDTTRGSNHMVRMSWKTTSELCLICHN
jgi:predicted CXXCH cytochrome family protein